MSMQRIPWLLSAVVVIGTTDRASANDVPSLEVLYKGTYTAPPASGPKPEAGKKVWIIPCAQELEACAIPADAMVEAAKSIGWVVTNFDGKMDLAVTGAGIRQAIAEKYDAIALYGIDCSDIRKPLIEAKKAGLKIAAAESFDCNETDASDQPLFDASVTYNEGSFAEWDKEFGRWQGYYVINKLEGKSEVIHFFNDEELATKISAKGVEDAFTKCKDCKLHNVEFLFASLRNSGDARSNTGTLDLQSRAEQLFERFPQANALIVPTDHTFLGGVGAAAATTQRPLLMMGGEGGAEYMQLVRQGGKQQAAGIGIPWRWEGYAVIDDLNRLFHGQKGAVSGIGLQVYDASHSMPKVGGYLPPIDFVAAYKKTWGVAQ